MRSGNCSVKIFFLILCLLTFENKVFSQPYIFYYADDPDYTTLQPVDTLTDLYSYFPICISADQNRAYRFIPGKEELVFRVWDIVANKRLPDDEYPGTVYVFDASTGELTQRLSLPPGGKTMTFPNYPQLFYYYNDSTNRAIAVSDTTVMPVEALLDTLISLKERCVANASIDNQGIANSLDSKLENAKRRLEAGDGAAAKNMLNAFVSEVEAQKGKHLTNEAYLLLKFNAEYVIGRLTK